MIFGLGEGMSDIRRRASGRRSRRGRSWKGLGRLVEWEREVRRGRRLGGWLVLLWRGEGWGAR